jgi:cytochrome c biogenesis protein ResB
MTRTARLFTWLGSLRIAVPLLIAIAVVLAWGTIYETRFGTAAVQRFVYRAWWFQGLLAFLAVNLALAALERYPWKRRHLPFVLAHLGIILILIGGIVGGRFGVEGQLIVQEGQAERVLQLPGNVLVVSSPNPGIEQRFPTRFETQAWVREPHTAFPVSIEGRQIRLLVDRYYPDAVAQETIRGDGPEENPAVHVVLAHGDQQEAVWLLARQPDRFGIGWGEGHVLFLEPKTESQFERLMDSKAAQPPARGIVTVHLEESGRTIEVPVPDERGKTVELKGTPYRITFKDYFPDFAIGEDGPTSQSPEPRNPAVSFTLSGPEGTDPHLLFALHPDIATMHGWTHRIKARVTYTHAASESLPPSAIVLFRSPTHGLAAVLTGADGERQVLTPVEVGATYTHPWLEYAFTVAAFEPRAQVIEEIRNRGDTVKGDAVHVVAQEGDDRAEAWIRLRDAVELVLGKGPLVVEYRPDQRELPVTIKLLDFRKIDYPGTQMAAEFESDVQLSDPQRGMILMRKISMNEPLRYRGYSFYQSSFIPGSVETTVLSVRSDPGTPLVYAGFLIVIGGVVAMFAGRRPARTTTRRGARA